MNILVEDVDVRKKIDDASKYVDGIGDYTIIDSTTVSDPFIKNCPICTGTEYPRKKVIYVNPSFIKRLDTKFLAFLLAHEKCHIEREECIGDEICASLCALDLLKMNEDDKKKVVKEWYYKYMFEERIITKKDYAEKFYKYIHNDADIENIIPFFLIVVGMVGLILFIFKNYRITR